DKPGGQQNVNEDIVELLEESLQRSLFASFRQPVAAEPLEAMQDVAGSEARSSVAVQQSERLIRADGVPGGNLALIYDVPDRTQSTLLAEPQATSSLIVRIAREA